MLKSITYKFFGRCFIVTMPLFFLSVTTPFGGLTLDRFFLFTTLFLMIVLAFGIKVQKNLISFSLAVFVVYVTINRLLSIDELNPKFFMLISSVLSFYIPFKISKSGVNLEKAINLSFIIFGVIGIYSIWHFLTNGYIPSRFDFLDSISFIRTVNYEHMESVNQSYIFPRNSLPYPTPPQLSIVMASYSFYFFSLYTSYPLKKYLFFFIVGVFIMLTTISRSGILPLLFVFFLSYSVVNKNNFILKFFKIILFIAILLLCLKYFNQDLYDVIYNRFGGSSGTDSNQEHLGVRLVALHYFFDGSLLQMLFGIGIGNYPNLHAHMTILTFLVEIGIVGTFIFLFIFFQRFWVTMKVYRKYRYNAINHLKEFMMLLLVFIGMLLYEFTYILPLYMLMGVSCGKSFIEIKKLKFNK